MHSEFRDRIIDQLVPVSLRWEKRSDICVIVPTCKTADITAATINTLLALHSAPAFDVVVIDNGGFDHEAIDQSFQRGEKEFINFVVVSENLGSAGSQYLGSKMALARNYQYLVHTDNDAVLKTTDGIHILVESLQKYDLVLPSNVARLGIPRRMPEEATFHYLALTAETVKKIGSPNPFFFLCVDDVEYVMRAAKMGYKVAELPNVSLEHILFKPALLANRTRYLMMRNCCYLVFRSNVGFRQRHALLIYIICLPWLEIFHSIQLKDSTIALSVIRGFRDFLTSSLDMDVPVERSPYKWIESSSHRMAHAREFVPLKNRVVLHKTYSVPDLNGTAKVGFSNS